MTTIMQGKAFIRSHLTAAALMLATAMANVFAQTNLPAAREIAAGPFQPTWESLAAQYQCPEWFRDAKFGIWAHWGPQCQPEHGDWYARSMYQQGSAQNKFHVAHYGPPSKFGFKDVIHALEGGEFRSRRSARVLQKIRREILPGHGQPSRQLRHV